MRFAKERPPPRVEMPTRRSAIVQPDLFYSFYKRALQTRYIYIWSIYLHSKYIYIIYIVLDLVVVVVVVVVLDLDI